MNNLITASQDTAMTSLELLEQVNAFRALNGENKILNTDFLKKVKDELGMDDVSAKSIKNNRGTESLYFDLTVTECLMILSREGRAARRLMSEKIEDKLELLSAYSSIEVDELPKDKYVYVIKNTKTGAYKVGISSHPERRVKELQVGCDGDLELVGFKQGTYADEAYHHKSLASKNIRSEWFILNNQDVKNIIQSGE